MKKYAYLILLALLVVIVDSGTVAAQATASGSIQGTVTANSQAVVVGAEVVAENKSTGASRSALTGENGSYRLELMPAGTYAVTVTKAGFAKNTATIELMVGQTATVNSALRPGAVSEVVEVTATAPMIDQTKTGVSQNITPDEVQELPLAARDSANLAYLVPGVKAANSYDPTKNRYAVISVDGQDGRNVNVTVNGVDNKDNTVGGTVMQLPLEAVQEFVISTQRFSAANGRSEGAAINMITKSGSNQYHGSLFGFFRDQVLNKTDFFSQGGDKPPYSRQFFGGSVGGPFVKDKLFGFFAYEHQREQTSFSETPSLYKELLLAKSIGAQPAAIIPTPFYETRYNGRMDYRFSDRQTAYFSYSSQGNNSLNDQSDGKGDLSEGNFTTNQLQIANLTVNSTLSSTLVNSFTAGWQYWNNNINSNTKVPLVTFGSGESFGTNPNVPQQSYQRKWQFRDDLTKTLGRHTLQGGVDYLWDPKLGGYFESNSTLEVDFASDPSVILQDPRGFATPGAVQSMSASSGDPHFLLAVKQFGAYFQDDWKVTKRLTVNLGIRWDKDFNLIGANAIQNSRTFEELQAIRSPYAKLPQDDNKDFSPRIGFAYDLTGGQKHILRGGYGLYYGNVFQNIPLFMIQQSNPTIYQGVFSLTTPTDVVPGTGIPLGTWRYGVDPFPTIPAPGAQLAGGATGRLMDPKYRNPYSEQFNLGYQWAVTNSSVFELEYVHELGLHENKTININPMDPNNGFRRPMGAAFAAAGVPVLGRVMDEQSINRSRYDGMNISFRQRMTHHVSFNANYTLSQAMGWAVESGGPPGSANDSGFRNYPHNPLNPWDPADFGPTPNDERNHVTVSGIVQLPWGFQVAPILQYGSARPLDLNQGYDVLGVGSGYSRPLIVNNGGPTDYLAYADPGMASAAQACLAASRCHQVGYDTLRGRSFFQLDTGVSKQVKLGERANLKFVFQAFNLTNKTNFGNDLFNTSTSGSKFLQPAGYINPNSTTIPRAFEGEFGFRLSF